MSRFFNNQDLQVGDRLHEDEVISEGYINMLKEQDEAFKALLSAYCDYCHAMTKQIDVDGFMKFTNHKVKWSERIKWD